MKYFEFTTKNFPYYALIGALNEVVAKAFYEETVCDRNVNRSRSM